MKNYSRQREAIIEYLKNSKEHPTAAKVYEEVRKVIPNISLGTVYRNLAKLSENGNILGISVSDGFEHFDGDISAHLHLTCKNCGKIIDVPLHEEIIFALAREEGFIPETLACVVYGFCAHCNQKKQ